MTVDLQTDRPHAARIYDYVLGGKDNFEADRTVAEQMMAASPLLAPSMRANRRFMARCAAHLAERGFRQFLDIGTGLPTHPNLHEVVQTIAPDANVLYVDNDPIVLVHARALLTRVPGSTGVIEYLDADLRAPDVIFSAPQFGAAIDLTKPVAVTVIAILQLIDDDDARRIIDDIMSRVPSGSALALSVVCDAAEPDGVGRILKVANAGGVPVRSRSLAGVEALFGGLELDEVGVVSVHHWRPGDEDEAIAGEKLGMYGGVAYKP